MFNLNSISAKEIYDQINKHLPNNQVDKQTIEAISKGMAEVITKNNKDIEQKVRNLFNYLSR